MPELLDPLGRFVLGTAQLGNLGRELSDEAARALVDRAWSLGVRRFDTAPHYGLGLSERRLGAALRDRPRDEYEVSTKVGRLLVPQIPTGSDDEGFLVPDAFRREWDPSAEGIRRSLKESLERTGLERIDTLYLHDPDRYGLRGLDTALDALAQLRAEGLVGRVGVGSTSVDALLAGTAAGVVDELMIAGRYTLLEQPAALELLPRCQVAGMDVIVAGVFNSGLLATPVPSDGDRYEYAPAPRELLERARALAGICADHGVELPSAALQFPLRHAAVTAVAVGADSADQLEQSLRRFTVPLPEELWAVLASG
ncbi:aldo/keto reductase [Rathayibacter sp. ZW T2_19]|uniref:Aldo/keto reductase n=1 Tax=Rathayibacter rubneri TaxID=2950106 RepID=A0A9X2IR89_9MICO|nr:aldo/keto reductase [Rathayibacter rubneri]MCM6761201.1 aldo/keto reductase [Rathayibacter rubneri]